MVLCSLTAAGWVNGPVPQNIVNQMVICGTKHYQGNLADPRAGGDVFNALRLYNSGFLDPNESNNPGPATGPYVIEIANRSRGWRN
jgi:hypothetical protein